MGLSITLKPRIRLWSGAESIAGGPRAWSSIHPRIQLNHPRTCTSSPRLSSVSDCVVGRPLTAEIALILPYVGVGFRKITANFGGWSAILPDDFAKFFIYTPYEPPGLISPKVVAGTLLYEPSLTGVKSRWKVETVYGDGQAVMTLYSDLIGPLLPIGFAIFNGRFPAGSWEGTLEWERNVEDRADKPLTARCVIYHWTGVMDLAHSLDSDA